MLSVTEVSQLFDDIRKAASKKAEPITCNVVLMNAGRQTESRWPSHLPCNISSRTRWHKSLQKR